MYLSIHVYATDNTVKWHIASINTANAARAGIYKWERRGDVVLDPAAAHDSRSILDAALRAMLARLGER